MLRCRAWLRSGAAPCVSWAGGFPPTLQAGDDAGNGQHCPPAGCDLLMENQAGQPRKWLLKQAVNVKAAPSTCLHNYWNNKALSTALMDAAADGCWAPLLPLSAPGWQQLGLCHIPCACPQVPPELCCSWGVWDGLSACALCGFGGCWCIPRAEVLSPPCFYMVFT